MKGKHQEVFEMKILVCYDGSDESEKALKLALSHAKAFEAKIDVVKAISRVNPLDYQDIKKAEQELELKSQEILNMEGTPYESHLLVNELNVCAQLVGFAGRFNIDEIIIGAPKRSRVGKFLLGSTAQYIILNAPCPVVTVN